MMPRRSLKCSVSFYERVLDVLLLFALIYDYIPIGIAIAIDYIFIYICIMIMDQTWIMDHDHPCSRYDINKNITNVNVNDLRCTILW